MLDETSRTHQLSLHSERTHYVPLQRSTLPLCCQPVVVCSMIYTEMKGKKLDQAMCTCKPSTLGGGGKFKHSLSRLAS